MEDNSFVIDTMEWSFSRLQAFYECKWEWYMHYVLAQPGENGFFGEYGTLIHRIFEKYFKGELSLFELNDYYEENFDKFITHDAPPNKFVDLRESYYSNGEEAINNFDFDFDKYDILGVEKRVNFQIGGKDFVGMIDLLVQDKNTGDIAIIDHKSATLKILKNGNTSKKDIPKFEKYKKQLYLYSLPVIEEYGKVDYLSWNMFTTQNWIAIPWVQEEYDESIQWAKDTIHLIEQEKEWLPNNNDFYYCNFLCGQRFNACEYKM